MSQVKIIESPISTDELKALAGQSFGDMVKGVADVEKGIIALGGELHADEEAVLLNEGSNQEDLWGFNLFVNEPRESWIEFDSMINLRPAQGNLSNSIENEEIQKKIIDIVNKLVK